MTKPFTQREKRQVEQEVRDMIEAKQQACKIMFAHLISMYPDDLIQHLRLIPDGVWLPLNKKDTDRITRALSSYFGVMTDQVRDKRDGILGYRITLREIRELHVEVEPQGSSISIAYGWRPVEPAVNNEQP